MPTSGAQLSEDSHSIYEFYRTTLQTLKEVGVNLYSVTAFPIEKGMSKLTIVPEKPDLFVSTMKKLGITRRR